MVAAKRCVASVVSHARHAVNTERSRYKWRIKNAAKRCQVFEKCSSLYIGSVLQILRRLGRIRFPFVVISLINAQRGLHGASKTQAGKERPSNVTFHVGTVRFNRPAVESQLHSSIRADRLASESCGAARSKPRRCTDAVHFCNHLLLKLLSKIIFHRVQVLHGKNNMYACIIYIVITCHRPCDTSHGCGAEESHSPHGGAVGGSRFFHPPPDGRDVSLSRGESTQTIKSPPAGHT